MLLDKFKHCNCICVLAVDDSGVPLIRQECRPASNENSQPVITVPQQQVESSTPFGNQLRMCLLSMRLLYITTTIICVTSNYSVSVSLLNNIISATTYIRSCS